MRRLGFFLLTFAMTLALAGPVAAAGPSGQGASDTPLGSYDILITSDVGCAGFDVMVEDISGRITDIYMGVDGRGYERFSTQFRTVTRYTRYDSETGEPTAQSFTSPFHSLANYAIAPDGTVTVRWANSLLAWAPEVQAMGLSDGIWLIEKGSGWIEYGLTETTAKLNNGRLTNVCDLLS